MNGWVSLFSYNSSSKFVMMVLFIFDVLLYIAFVIESMRENRRVCIKLDWGGYSIIEFQFNDNNAVYLFSTISLRITAINRCEK